MSSAATITLSTLKFIKPAQLADQLQDPSNSSRVAIVDVRDSDHIGGHIKSSTWVPANQLDVKMPELLRTLKDKDQVVFHCMLSQQRGPKAALAYARAKAHEVEKARKEAGESEGESCEQMQSDEAARKDSRVGGQQVCVLEGGFSNWQSVYGDDAKLTEAYQKDLWQGTIWN